MRKEAEEWLEKAREDLETAKDLLELERLGPSAFYSHQAAEKALKAFYIQKFKRLWKIHDLKQLASRLDSPRWLIKISDKLNPFYIEARYPTKAKHSIKSIQDSIKSARKVFRWVKEKLS